MPETIESLLEENLGKVQELLASSEQLHEDVSQLQSWAERLDEQLETSANASVQALQSFQEIVASMASAFDQAESEAEAKLDEVIQHVSEVASKAQTTADEVTQAVQSQRENLDSMQAQVEGHVEEATADLQQLSEISGDFREVVKASSEALDNAAEQLRGILEAALTEMQSRTAAAGEALTNVQSAAAEGLDSWAVSVEQGVSQTQQQVTSVLNDVDARSTSCVDHMTQQLADGAVQHLLGAVEEAVTALTGASQLTEVFGGDFGGSLEDVMDNIKEIVELIEKIKPVLDAVKELL